MIKLLIADDEILEREGLAYILQTLMPGRFEYALAENGRKTIEIAENFHPDIIFLDIKMPGVSGLDAAQTLRERFPESKIIIVTAYDYFDYAKEALQVGAKDYLLKPVRLDKLLELMDQLVNEIQIERRKRLAELDLKEKTGKLHQLAESDFTLHLMQGIMPSPDHYELLEIIDPDNLFGYSLVARFSKQEFQSHLNIQTEIRKHLSSPNLIFVSSAVGNHIGVFCLFETADSRPSYRLQALQTARQLSQVLEDFTLSPAVVGIGRSQMGPQGWYQSYLEAFQATRFDLSSKCRFFEDNRPSVTQDQLIQKEKDLVDALLEGNRQRIAFELDEFVKIALGRAEGRIADVRSILAGMLTIISWQAGGMGLSLPSTELDFSSDSVQGLIDDFTRSIYLMANRMDEMRGNSISTLHQAKTYMENHYAEELTLERMAEYAQLSPFYFSKQFKTMFGQSFVEYLTHLRMEASRRLIARGRQNLKEICYAVGYNNPTYFSRVFKKYFGVSPSEFKE